MAQRVPSSSIPGRRYFVLLLPWLAAIALATAASMHLGRVHTDLTQLLPQGEAPSERLLLGQLREGPAARLILIALSGADAGELARISRDLQASLAENMAFSQVENGAIRLEDPSLRTLYPLRYLLGPNPECRENLHTDGLRQALEARLQELSGPFPPVDKQGLAADPTACLRALMQARRPATEPHREHGVWFSRDGAAALLMAQTRASASDLDAQQAAIDSIREAFARAAAKSQASLEIAGPGTFGVDSRDLIRAETTRLSLLGSLLVVLILFAALRNPWIVLLGALPPASGILAGILAVEALFGSIQGVSLAMGICLLGVTIDYPIHVAGHQRFRRSGSVRGIWPTLLLGVATTAIGFLALTLTDFVGLVQLGVLAVVGILVAALSSRYLLPPMLDAVPRGPGHRRLQAPTLAKAPARGPALPIVAGLISGLLLVALIGHGLPWETDLRRLSTVSPAQFALDQRLRSELGAPDVSRLFYQWSDNPEQALQAQEQILPDLARMVEEGRVQGFQAAAQFLPSAQTQRQRQADLPSREELASNLEQALQGLPFRRAAFAPFAKDVAAAKNARPATIEDLEKSPVGASLRSLLMPIDQRWLSLIPLIGVPDSEQAIPSAPAGMRYLDIAAASSALIDRFTTETLAKLEVSAAAMVLVLLIGLRDLGRLGRVLVAIGLTLQLDLVLIVLLDGQLNLFHLVGLLLVLGLSIDYSLFFTRRRQTHAERRATLATLALCAFSSFAMFALLGLSSIPVLHAIGTTVAIGVALAFVLSWALGDSQPLPDGQGQDRSGAAPAP